MKTVAFVPIKLNNERLPGKNLMRFTNGEPLLTYTLTTLTQVKSLDTCYVYCSNPDIKQYLPHGIELLQRPETLDSNKTTFNDILKEFSKEIDADIYMLSHVTSPFASIEMFEAGISAVKSGTYDSAFSVERMYDFIWQDNKPVNYNPQCIPRTQDLQIMYKEAFSMYVFSRNVALQSRRIGDTPFLVECDKIAALDINDTIDFAIADAVFNLKNAGRLEKKHE